MKETETPLAPAEEVTMKARQLEVFCMLMRCRTVTRAAEMLNISQPALSQVLLHLEDQIGFKLFNRVKGRLVPTAEAEELYPEAERIFSELATLRRRTGELRHGRTGLVRIAASAPPSMSIVPKAMSAFRQAHPDIVVRSLIAPIANIIEMLRSGEVSIGMAMNNLNPRDIHSETVGEAELVCLVPAGHRLEAEDSIGFADLAGETLISYRAETLPASLLIAAAEAEDQIYAPAIEIDLSITAMPFVRDGLGVAIVDGLLPWETFPGIVKRPFHPRITVPIAILTSKERPISGVHQIMRDFLIDACKTLGPQS